MKIYTPHKTMGIMAIAIICMTPLWPEEAQASQTMREKIKATIGGAEYVVTGELVDFKDNMYMLRTSGGETLQLEVTDDTNMFCLSRSGESQSTQISTSNRQSMSSDMGMKPQLQTHQEESSIGVDEKQVQSQESQPESQSTGFRIGDCPFQKGDVIKAELTDIGTVTFMRSVDPQTSRSMQAREMNEGKGSGRSTEEMGLPQEYVFLPAGALGSLNVQESDHYTVETSDGEEVGYVYKVILSKAGDPSYIIIREKDTQQLKPLPWQAVQVSQETQTVTLVVSRSQMDQLPGYSPNDISMNKIQSFWEIAKAEKERRVSRQQAREQERFLEGPYKETFPSDESQYTELDPSYPEYPNLGARPGEAGEPGEVSIFGSPSTLPPGEHAPQYTGADKQRFQGDHFRNRQGRGENWEDRQFSLDHNRQSRYADEDGRRAHSFDPRKFSDDLDPRDSEKVEMHGR